MVAVHLSLFRHMSKLNKSIKEKGSPIHTQIPSSPPISFKPQQVDDIAMENNWP